MPLDESQMMQLESRGGFKCKGLKGSVVKTELSQSENVIVFPTYQYYAPNAANAKNASAYKKRSQCKLEKCSKN